MDSPWGRGRARGRGAPDHHNQQNPVVGVDTGLDFPTIGEANPVVGIDTSLDFPNLGEANPVVGIDTSLDFPTIGEANPGAQKSSGRGRGISKNKSEFSKSSRNLSCSKLSYDKKLDDNTPTITVPPTLQTNFQLCKHNSKLATRPGYGKCGRPIELISNYFKLKLNGTVYHYDIEINSLKEVKKQSKTKQLTAAEAAKRGVSKLAHELDRGVGKLKCKEVFEKLVQCKCLEKFSPVFDGVKNMFTSKPLPFENKQTFTIELEMGGKSCKYEVVIKPVKKSDGNNKIILDKLTESNENEAIMALNSIMSHRDARCSQIQIGRSFFYLNQSNKANLGEGLEIWFGYHQSVHSTEKGAVVLINLAAKAFHKDGPIIDHVSDILRRDIRRGESIKPYELQNVISSLKGLRVEVTHLPYPRRYVIQGVSKLPAQEMKLNFDGKEITVAQYFERKYRKLQFPFLPCLHMRSSTQTYIPFEHCKVIKGQPKMGKINPNLGAKMIKQTAIAPIQRFTSIMKSSQDVQKESGNNMRNYNIFLDLQMMPVSGRVLEPPSLVYSERDTAVLPDARGIWNMSGKKLFRSIIDVKSWIIIDFANCSRQIIGQFVDCFLAAGRKIGLNFGKLLDVKCCGKHISVSQALNNAEETKASFAIIILSRRDRFHSYDEIKFIADYKLQFINQCIDEKILERFNDQIATNLCLKVNAKLGGVNHVLRNKPRIFSKPIMIFGADAVHSPRGSRCPSIAAVVGSMDAHPSKYKIVCRVQENPDGNKISQELILEMREMVTNLLKTFYHNTKGKYPEKIIFFRDGVSEGQFQTVYEYEVRKIQEACQEQVGYIVPITFVVVQKRHQTRFKPKYERDGIGRVGNIPPGTTVDTDIVHPYRFDYFLNSHEGIQGTCKSAHYTVLHDDNQFSADELQQLSYHLCYTYNKCNRSISIPAPVKYADLACYRAKKYADFHLQKEQESGTSSSDYSMKLPDHAKKAINTMGELGKNFFFV